MTLIFGRIVVDKEKNKINKDPNFWLNGRGKKIKLMMTLIFGHMVVEKEKK